MSTQFPKFKKLHRPAANTQPVPADTVTGYRGLLPDEVLTQWRDTEWCSYGDGFLWFVNPAEYDGILSDWLTDAVSCTVFMRRRSAG